MSILEKPPGHVNVGKSRGCMAALAVAEDGPIGQGEALYQVE